jgi:hypothetical protein
MKPQEVIFIPDSKTGVESSSAGESQKAASEKVNRVSLWERTPRFFQGLALVVLALVIAATVYTFAVYFLPEGMNYFLKHLVGLVTALLILAAVDSIKLLEGSKPSIKAAVIIFLCVIFLYKVINHYAGKNETENNGYSSVSVGSAKSGPSIHYRPDSIFTRGTYHIKFNGETPFNICIDSKASGSRYYLASLGGDYVAVYDDGEPISDGPGRKTVFPYKKEPVFYLQADGETTVRLKVN